MKKKVLLTAEISYWRPDYPSLLQLFILQRTDFLPGLPRLHQFLNYWKQNMPTPLHQIRIMYPDCEWSDWRLVDEYLSAGVKH